MCEFKLAQFDMTHDSIVKTWLLFSYLSLESNCHKHHMCELCFWSHFLLQDREFHFYGFQPVSESIWKNALTYIFTSLAHTPPIYYVA